MDKNQLFDCIVENLKKEFSVQQTHPGMIILELENKENMMFRLLPDAETNELIVFFREMSQIQTPTKDKTMYKVVHNISKTIKELKLFYIVITKNNDSVYCHSQELKNLYIRLDYVRKTISEKKNEFRGKYRLINGFSINHFQVTKEEMKLTTINSIEPNKFGKKAIELLGSFQTKEEFLSLLDEIETAAQTTYSQVQKIMDENIKKLNANYSKEDIKFSVFYYGPQKTYIKVSYCQIEVHCFLFEPESLSDRIAELTLRIPCIEEIKNEFLKRSVLKECNYDFFELGNHWLSINDEKITIEIEKKNDEFQLRCFEYKTKKCILDVTGNRYKVISDVKKQAEKWAQRDRLRRILY